MKRFAALLVALVLGVVIMASPSQAVTCIGSVCYGGSITVSSNPPGAGRGVIITCHWSNPNAYDHVVTPGTSSRRFCFDADGAYVAPGREIVCYDQIGPYVQWDATGWHKFTDLFNQLCYDRAD
jgi:hypothetical protein